MKEAAVSKKKAIRYKRALTTKKKPVFKNECPVRTNLFPQPRPNSRTAHTAVVVYRTAVVILYGRSCPYGRSCRTARTAVVVYRTAVVVFSTTCIVQPYSRTARPHNLYRTAVQPLYHTPSSCAHGDAWLYDTRLYRTAFPFSTTAVSRLFILMRRGTRSSD